MIFYQHNADTLTEAELRQRFFNVSFPAVIKPDELPDGVTVMEVEEAPLPIVPLAELKNMRCAEIRAQSDRRIDMVRSGYSQGEINTFAQQYSGARYISQIGGTSEDSLLVISLLSNRLGRVPYQREITAFAELIIANYEQAGDVTVSIIGTQQRLEIAIREASTREDVEAISWPG